MQDKEFNELLKALGKDKKVEDEEETPPKSRPEIKMHKAGIGKTFYARWMERRDESEKL